MATWQVPGGNLTLRADSISDQETATATHVSVPSVFRGLIVKTDGTNDVTITVRNNTAVSGTAYLLPSAFLVLGEVNLWAFSFGNDGGPIADTGINVEISVAGGGAAAVQVLYDKGSFA